MLIHPTFEDYQAYSQGADWVPLFARVMGDGLTPVAAYQKMMPSSPYSYLLESVQQDDRLGRFSFIGANPLVLLTARGTQIHLDQVGQAAVTKEGNPFAEVMKLVEQFKLALPDELKPFQGSLVGYFGYDCIRHIERIPDANPDDLQLPEACFLLPRTVVMFDNLSQSITLIELAQAGSRANYSQAQSRLEDLRRLLASPAAPDLAPLPAGDGPEPQFTSNTSEADYHAMVEKAKHYIKEGDIFQVVLSQRFEMPYPGDAFQVYRALRRINPSPYLFFLKFPEFQIAGSSPEILVKKEGETLTLRPIAGTRRRGKTHEEDLALQQELLDDPKELSEHMMLVDLGRNDLGRVSAFGSVAPTRFKYIENYSHVMHIVTNLESRIAPQASLHEVLMSCFPAGTLTGAPKIRAMEIIDELEHSRRGFYGGTVVHLDFAGDLDSCIGIRSVVIKGHKAYVQAGAGIVADSQPAAEQQECLNKAKAVLKAVVQGRNQA